LNRYVISTETYTHVQLICRVALFY